MKSKMATNQQASNIKEKSYVNTLSPKIFSYNLGPLIVQWSIPLQTSKLSHSPVFGPQMLFSVSLV